VSLSFFDRTYRALDDGERIEGTWRHVFINNGGRYFLSDLKIYADGLIDCWGLVDLEGFREKVREGWVATRLPEKGQATAHHLGAWQFKNPTVIDSQQLIKEVEETIAELQGIPTTSSRCLASLDIYVANTSEENRLSLKEAYFAIPAHLRMYVLGDQDMADWPIRVLIGELGEPLMPRFPPFKEPPITKEDREGVFRYLEARKARAAQYRIESNEGDPDGPPAGTSAASIGFGGMKIAKGGGWVDMDGYGYLSNDVPTAVTVDGVEYPSVTHAYWALSTDDSAAKEKIRLAPNATDAHDLGRAASRRTNWPLIRLAVMAELVRLKFRQHPDLAAKLVTTGDARIRGIGFSGRYWDEGGSRGRNWLGRILEMVRSELIQRQDAGGLPT
jgi:ribA/ribD-fused uncharacterized protein